MDLELKKITTTVPNQRTTILFIYRTHLILLQEQNQGLFQPLRALRNRLLLLTGTGALCLLPLDICISAC
jgi:hypothetical protein